MEKQHETDAESDRGIHARTEQDFVVLMTALIDEKLKLQATVASYEQKLRYADDEVQTARKEEERHREELAKSAGDNEHLEMRLQDANVQIKMLQKEVAEVNARFQEMESSFETAKADHREQLNAQIQTAQEIEKKHRPELALDRGRLKAKNSSAKTAQDEHQNEVIDLRNRVTQLEQELSRAQPVIIDRRDCGRLQPPFVETAAHHIEQLTMSLKTANDQAWQFQQHLHTVRTQLRLSVLSHESPDAQLQALIIVASHIAVFHEKTVMSNFLKLFVNPDKDVLDATFHLFEKVIGKLDPRRFIVVSVKSFFLTPPVVYCLVPLQKTVQNSDSKPGTISFLIFSCCSVATISTIEFTMQPSTSCTMSRLAMLWMAAPKWREKQWKTSQRRSKSFIIGFENTTR